MTILYYVFLVCVWKCTALSLSQTFFPSEHRIIDGISTEVSREVIESKAAVADAVEEISYLANVTRAHGLDFHYMFQRQSSGGSELRNRQLQWASSWWWIIRDFFINTLVVIPCIAVGGPLVWIWYHLEAIGKDDVVFTAMDADLREVEISRVGASGVALLRRQGDRHTGIMFAFTGIMLQTIFIYFIAVSCILRIHEQATSESEHKPTPIILLFCSLFCNAMVCCSSVILGNKCLATTAPEGYQELHEILVLLDSFVIPAMCTVVGALYLCTSNGISSLVFNATAMGFIISINMQIAGLMSWSLSGHGGRAFQPANVSIKDSQNSTQHAHYSFKASAVVATIMLPLGLIAGPLIIVFVGIATVGLPFVLFGYHLGYYRTPQEFQTLMYDTFSRTCIRCECVKKQNPPATV